MPTFLLPCLAFALVSFGLVLNARGRNMIYLISRSITQGPAGGLISLGRRRARLLCFICCARRSGSPRCLFAVPYAYDALRLSGRGVFAVVGLAGVEAQRPARRSR